MTTNIKQNKWWTVLFVSALGCEQGPSPQEQEQEPENYGREIAEETPLLDEEGNLVAQGWAHRPFMLYDRSAVAQGLSDRVREWDFCNVAGPDFSVDVTVSYLGFASYAEVAVHDFATKTTEKTTLINVIEPLQVEMSATPYDATRFEYNEGIVELRVEGTTRTIDFSLPGTVPIQGHFELDESSWPDSIAAARPFDDPRYFFYENKIVGPPAIGEVTVGDKTYVTSPSSYFGTLDWGRGVWPSEAEWTWGHASGVIGERVIGVNIGRVSGDESLGTADAVFVDGKLHKQHTVAWDFNPDDLTQPWHFASEEGRIDLTLEPDYPESVDTDIPSLVSTRLRKIHGRFSGQIILEDGTTIDVSDLLGSAEHMSVVW